jgi:hypothetical protein
MRTAIENKRQKAETTLATTKLLTFLTPAQVSQILGVPEARLCIWRITGEPALAFHKFGKSVRYSLEEVEAFIARNAKNHTGDAA